MDLKSSLVIGVCIIVASAVLGLTLSLRPADPLPPGRFQITGSPGHAFVLDTATGQVWENFEPESQGGNTVGFSDPKLRGKP